MATLFVDKVDPQSGTALEIGSSGDTITIPSGATINLSNATQTGVGGVNTPAFEATLSSNTGYMTNNTYVKVQFNSEIFDVGSAYDSTSNYRFTPQTAGKYFIYGSVRGNANANSNLRNMYISIYKNGSQYKESRINYAGTAIREVNIDVAANMIFNGSSDYVELYAAIDDDSGNNQGYFTGGLNITYFGAYKIIE